MEAGITEIYLLGANALGFVSVLLSKKKEGGREILPFIISFLGGAAGTALSYLLFSRKPDKENMTTRVAVSCLVVTDTICYLMYRGFMHSPVTFAFWIILSKYPPALAYLAFVNVLTFFFFFLDKKNAEKGKKRVKITTLLSLSAIGGSIGATVAMYSLRHKTQKAYFSVGVPLIAATQVFLLFYLSNTVL